MADPANQIWRDFVTDGVPASGAHKPQKSKIREWGAEVENTLEDLDQDALRVFQSTGAVASADLTGVTAIVVVTVDGFSIFEYDAAELGSPNGETILHDDNDRPYVLRRPKGDVSSAAIYNFHTFR